MADDDLVLKFLKALADTGQKHVVKILDPEGLITGTYAVFTWPILYDS